MYIINTENKLYYMGASADDCKNIFMPNRYKGLLYEFFCRAIFPPPDLTQIFNWNLSVICLDSACLLCTGLVRMVQ